MTLNQLAELTDDELCACLYVINVLSPLKIPGCEFSPENLTWIRHDMLIKKLLDNFPKVKQEHHPIYSSLLTKLGVKHEIKYNAPTTGSNEQSGSI